MIREQRLDPVVHYLEVEGEQPVPELTARFDEARYEQATRPALAASPEQALTILKPLRPKTALQP